MKLVLANNLKYTTSKGLMSLCVKINVFALKCEIPALNVMI